MARQYWYVVVQIDEIPEFIMGFPKGRVETPTVHLNRPKLIANRFPLSLGKQSYYKFIEHREFDINVHCQITDIFTYAVLNPLGQWIIIHFAVVQMMVE